MSAQTHRFIYHYDGANDPSHNTKKRAVLLIDPQNDFIHEAGALPIPGASESAKRVAAAITREVWSIDQIYVTLDTHQRMHIAHPLFWQDKSGGHPEAYTKITKKDLANGKWKPSIDRFSEWANAYVSELEKAKKFKLTIWPPHCLVGTEGHALYAEFQACLQAWEEQKKTTVAYYTKGTNALTEHYSAFKAEVQRPGFPETNLDVGFLEELDTYDEIVVAGQALSHCVNYSVRDLVEWLEPEKRSKVVVLVDGSDTIAGYDDVVQRFKEDMKKLGVRFMKTDEVFPSIGKV